MSVIVLRPYLPGDAAKCAEIFRAAIELSSDDYGDAERDAWAAKADDLQAFAARFAASLTLVALIDSELIGFASLRGASEIDMLYVDPRYARQGAASSLLDALTRLAAARGADALTSEVSDTARALFERLGFAAQRRNLVQINDQWLANTTMTKRLAAPGGDTRAPTRH